MGISVNTEQFQRILDEAKQHLVPFVLALTGDLNTPLHWRILGEDPSLPRNPLGSETLTCHILPAFPITNESQLADLLCRNLEGWSVYLTINDFHIGVGHKKKQISRMRAAATEIDLPKKAPPGWKHGDIAGVSSAWNQAWPLPTIQVESRNGPHFYWVYPRGSEPSVVDGEALNRAIRGAIPSDGVADATRVFRAPGFFHWKKWQPGNPLFLTKLVFAEPTRTWHPDALTEALKPFAAVVSQPSQEAPQDPTGRIAIIDPLPNPAEYRRAVLRAAEYVKNMPITSTGQRGSTLFKTVCHYLRDEALLDAHALVLMRFWADHRCETTPSDEYPFTDDALKDKWYRSAYGSRIGRIGENIQNEREGFPVGAGLVDAVKQLPPTAPTPEQEKAVNPGSSNPQDQRKVVIVRPQHSETLRTVESIISRLPGVFCREGKMVRVLETATGPRIENITKVAIARHVTDLCQFAKFKKSKENWELENCGMPNWLCPELVEMGVFPNARPLLSFSVTPRIRIDGSLCIERGYDADAQQLYLPPPELIGLQVGETQDAAVQALRFLMDLIADFPFTETVSRVAWVAALLTAFCRQALNGPAPGFMADGNKANIGKSKLLDMITTTVGEAHVMNTTWLNPESDREGRASYHNIQRVNTALKNGKTVLALDNVSGKFGDPDIDRLLTLARWDDRELGSLGMVSAPINLTVIITSNNLQPRADTWRRIIPIRLVYNGEDRPPFKYPDIVDHVRHNRRQVIEACLTILRAFYVAGRPNQAGTLGSYERWCEWVPSALVWLSMPDVTTLIDYGDEAGEDSTAMVERQAVIENVELMNQDLWVKDNTREKQISVTEIEVLLAQDRSQMSQRYQSIIGILTKRLRHPGDAITRDLIGTLLRRHRDNGMNGRILIMVKDVSRNKPTTWRVTAKHIHKEKVHGNH